MTRPSKAQRQHRITHLLAEHRVTSQHQLIELLAAESVTVNQATVSRDLEELGAVKIRIPGGDTAYAIPEIPAHHAVPTEHLRRVMGEWVVEMARSGDLVVLRTPPGSAHVVASALDRSSLPGVLGTVAGDDTILVIATEANGSAIQDELAELAGLGTG